MSFLACRASLITLVAIGASGSCLSQSSDTPAGLTVFGAQRFWFATQNVKLNDVAIELPGGTASPVIRSLYTEISSSAVVPITALGVRYGKVLATLSVSPTTSFGSNGLTRGGQVQRQEYDLSLGYAALPSATLSLIYKRGKFGPSYTAAAQDLFGFSNPRETGQALLLGVSTSAPLGGAFSLYANLAYGAGRWKSEDDTTGTSRYPSRYTVGDFGVAWRAGGPASVTVQLGYRTQLVTVKNVDLPILSLPDQQIISTSRVDVPLTTHGAIFSVTAAF